MLIGSRALGELGEAERNSHRRKMRESRAERVPEALWERGSSGEGPATMGLTYLATVRRKLLVTVHRAHGLPVSTDDADTNLPYAEISLCGQRKRTRAVPAVERIGEARTASPVWEERFELLVTDESYSGASKLCVKVFHEHFMRSDKEVCAVSLPVNTLLPGGPWWCELHGRRECRPMLQLSFEWEPGTPHLVSEMEEVGDVPGARDAAGGTRHGGDSGSANPGMPAASMHVDGALYEHFTSIAHVDEQYAWAMQWAESVLKPGKDARAGAHQWTAAHAHMQAWWVASLPHGTAAPPFYAPPHPPHQPAWQGQGQQHHPSERAALDMQQHPRNEHPKQAQQAQAARPFRPAPVKVEDSGSPVSQAGNLSAAESTRRVGQGLFAPTPLLQREARNYAPRRASAPSTSPLVAGLRSSSIPSTKQLDRIAEKAESLKQFFTGDLDRSGTLDVDEFSRLERRREGQNAILTAEALQQRFTMLDVNGDGRIDLQEYVNAMAMESREGWSRATTIAGDGKKQGKLISI